MRGILATGGILLMVIALLATGCGRGREPATPTPTSPPPTPTSVPPTATPAPPTPTPKPAATPTPKKKLEKVILEFRTTVPSVEDADRVLEILLEEPGVEDGLADENSLTITYDPEVTTVEEIREIVEAEGFPLREE
ncbi:MAG: hypothetical protein ACE5LU_07020 [Anaerolineae bacterium]